MQLFLEVLSHPLVWVLTVFPLVIWAFREIWTTVMNQGDE